MEQNEVALALGAMNPVVRVTYAKTKTWHTHGDSPFVKKYKLSGEKYFVLGYETTLHCCGKKLHEHGWVSTERGDIICPGQVIVAEVRDHQVTRLRVMDVKDVAAEYEEIR